MKYQLFHFYEGRVALSNTVLKDSQTTRDQSELLSDLIVFEKNELFENYILSFETLDPIESEEKFTLSVFSFTEVQLIEIPFRKIL